jgi:opacity protein-like surface antigen
MKRLITILILILFSLTINAQFTKLGGGLTFASGFHFNNETGFQADLHRSPNIGIFVTGIYELNLPFHIAPSFTCFIPRTNELGLGTTTEKTRISEIMFDINGHYVFNSLDKFEFYGLAGLNITLAKLKWVGTSSSGNDNALGLNIGVGSYMKVTEQLDFFLEAKYIVSKYDQFMLNAGVLMNLQWFKMNENQSK